MSNIRIDGSIGEGGGQIPRTALGLSLVTGKPFEIKNIRAGRRKPGLLRQHLTALKAAKQISSADVRGAQIGSTEFSFSPRRVQAGDYHFAVGTAGSTTLVLQTILPALMLADGPSTVVIEGGTHNPYAPPFPFLERSFIPVLRHMGVGIDLELNRYGFYPAGGGKFTIRIDPVEQLNPLEINERGELVAMKARIYTANLPDGVASREKHCLQNRLSALGDGVEVIDVQGSHGPGNVVTVELQYEHVTEVFTGFGELYKSAEKVVNEVVNSVNKYMSAGSPVGPHLADQLMIPFALAGSGSYKTAGLSRHSITNLEIIKKFIRIQTDIEDNEQNQNIVCFREFAD